MADEHLRKVPTRRPIFRYAVLAVLFAITVAYEVPYLRDILRDERRSVPLFATEDGSNVISFVDRVAKRIGFQKGDQVLSVNGRLYRGEADWFQISRKAPVGQNVTVVVRSGESAKGGERSFTFPIESTRPDFWEISADLIVQVLIPVFSVALGFWVAFMRPRDSMAWLLLALMLTFPHIFESYKVQGWPRGWREAAEFYHTLLGSMLPIVMFLFGRDFPEPFPSGSREEKIWNYMQWGLVLPYALLALLGVIGAVGSLSNYRSVAPLERATHPFDVVTRLMTYALIGSFFAAMGVKYGLTQSPDAKRRLRILYWGSTAAWTPGLLMTIAALVAGKSVYEMFPRWTVVVVVTFLLLFPLTLAYVIVVQKAMDVSLVVRQGLQYALARRGTRVLQVIAIVGVASLALTMASDVNRKLPQRLVLIAIGVVAVLTIRRAGDWLRAWIDRRFFREAYDTEQVLTELSDQVRSIVEPKSLLETVASRISQTLHVPQVAVLLGADLYQPAYAMGFADLSDVTFTRNAGTVQVLRRQKEPARVYLNNRDSWLYREEEVDDAERAKLGKLGAELLLPLAVRDKLLGFISLGPKRSEEPYTGSDVRLLKSVAAQTGLALENADLMRKISDEVAQRERLNREVEIAREVQERLFPQKLPAIPGVDYAAFCRPALAVGGDYYDFLALPQGQLGVAIGDVAGKGIAAALMMASLQASLRGEATRAPENLATAIANINRLLYDSSASNRYATFFYGQYDPTTGRLDYVNAGHNPPMLFRCRQGCWEVTRLEVGGTVIGLIETFPYQQGSVTIAPGDTFIAFTDGISEAMNNSDDEWGEDALIQSVECCNGLRAQEVLDRVFKDCDEFVAGAKQHDDMTLLVMRVLSQP
jgi:sigma-B regulation protein RsbU (phosphoserine phosphatase)